jgi:hypothetical protein
MGPTAKNWAPILGAPNSTSLGHVRPCIFRYKNSYHQIGMAPRCKGVGPNFSLLANHKWECQASYTMNWPSL